MPTLLGLLGTEATPPSLELICIVVTPYLLGLTVSVKRVRVGKKKKVNCFSKIVHQQAVLPPYMFRVPVLILSSW